jgi:hypothetical protein
VSGVGDDANPCSRTAPCKTFAGAISKTAAGGEIDVLDPGGFGGVTITKSISIEANGELAGVLVAGTNGITVNAGPTDVVVLRGLTIEGIATGLSGVSFLAGGALFIENCTINGFATNGINFRPSADAFLSVKDTNVRDCPLGGIVVSGSNGGNASASFERVRSEGNGFGFRVEGGARVSAKSSLAAMNKVNGFVISAPAGIAGLDLDGCASINNGRANAAAGGVVSSGAQATVRMGNTIVTNNPNGLVASGGGLILSYGNNSITGNNVADGAPTGSVVLH